MKKEKFYIPVILNQNNCKSRNQSVTMLNANNIKELSLILPTKQLIKNHLDGEMKQVLAAKELDIKYEPKPLFISISKERLLPILREIHKKTGIITSIIPLVFQSGCIPCCVIGHKSDSVEMEDGYLIQEGDKIQIIKNSGMNVGELCVHEIEDTKCLCSLFGDGAVFTTFPSKYTREGFAPILEGEDGWLNEDYVYKIIK